MKVKMNEWNRNEALCPQEDAEYQITKVITLPKENYRYFINHSQKEYDFIKENADQMGIRKRIRTDLHRCILLRCAESLEGVLINADGCGYAKYSAHLPSVGLLLQPDLFVICQNDAVDNGKYIEGAPDFVIEVLSPSTAVRDMKDKLNAYFEAGVREYWVIDPDMFIIDVFSYENAEMFKRYTFEDQVPVGISGGGLSIDFRPIRAIIEKRQEV